MLSVIKPEPHSDDRSVPENLFQCLVGTEWNYSTMDSENCDVKDFEPQDAA